MLNGSGKMPKAHQAHLGPSFQKEHLELHFAICPLGWSLEAPKTT